MVTLSRVDGESISKYSVSDWRRQLHQFHQSDWKSVFYWILRPVIDRFMRGYLTSETLNKIKPDMVLGVRGMPLSFHRSWSCDGRGLHGKVLVVQGVGNGWEVASWARLRPRKIIGVDLFGFDSWSDVKDVVEREYQVEVEFHVAPLACTNMLPDSSVDMVVSNAVYEHVVNMREVMQETYRILKPKGVVASIYSPLWYCAGGDHFSGRGGLKNIFNHLLLEIDEYQNYFDTYKEGSEDFQSGARYVELDLFSKLRTDEYLGIYLEAGFELDGLLLQIEPEAIAFKRKYSKLFEKVKERNRLCSEDDFLIKTNFVRLVK